MAGEYHGANIAAWKRTAAGKRSRRRTWLRQRLRRMLEDIAIVEAELTILEGIDGVTRKRHAIDHGNPIRRRRREPGSMGRLTA